MLDSTKLQSIDLNELQQYINDERDKQERAAQAERRAQLDKILEETEARRLADAQEAAKRRAAADPNNRVAEWLFGKLGDEWPEFVRMMGTSNLKGVVAAINKLESARAADVRHRSVADAPVVREAAKAVAQTVLRSKIEQQLAAAGIMNDVTVETDLVPDVGDATLARRQAELNAGAL